MPTVAAVGGCRGFPMTAMAFIFVVVLTAIHVETFAGSMGVLAPLTALTVFYFSGVFGARAGIFIGVAAGAVLDALYCRAGFATPVEMAVVAALAPVWIRQGDPASSLPNLLPGAAAALIVTLPQILWSAWDSDAWPRGLLLAAFGAGFGAFAFPILIHLLDFIAAKLGLPRYKTARADADSKGRLKGYA